MSLYCYIPRLFLRIVRIMMEESLIGRFVAFKVPELGESPSSGTPTVLLKATKLPRRDS